MNSQSAHTLNGASIEISFTPYDWTGQQYHNWSVVQPDPSSLTREQCHNILISRDDISGTRREVLDKTGNIELWRSEVLCSDKTHWDEFYPVLNYYADIPETYQQVSASVMQARLRHTPIAVVQFDDTYKLVACAGYPNMALEFCRAYVLLGYLPPFSMINFALPHSKLEPELICACQRTIELVQMQCKTLVNALGCSDTVAIAC